jgi:hypothetical protein
VGQVAGEAQENGGPLTLRQPADRRPHLGLLVSRQRRRPLGQVVRGQRAAAARPGRIDRLSPRDRQDPGAQVRVGAQARIRAQRGDERLLEGVVGIVRADQRPQEPEDLVAVGIEERLERWKGHVSITVAGAPM